jgi:hypothetical protein
VRACSVCGCVETDACIEVDQRGVAHACYWAASDCCSACFFDEWVEPPEADEGVDTRLRFKGRVVFAPALAGTVARPRR